MAFVNEGVLENLGYEQLTSLSSSKGLQSIPKGARFAIIQAESQNVRWRDGTSGTAPTATVGMRLAAGTDFFYNGQLNLIRFIEEAASAKVNVAYYGWGSA